MSKHTGRSVSSCPSLASRADSLRPAAVKVAAEPRRSETLTARTAATESASEGRRTGTIEKIRATESVERFSQEGMTSSTPEKSSSEQLRPEIPKLSAEEIEVLLRRLNLARTRRTYAEVADRAEKEEWSYRDFLAFLLAEEVAHRQQTRLVCFTRKAHFPFFRTIEEFDFQRQPVLRKSHLGSYLEPDFVREGRSLVLYGKHGRGKTHLAVAIGYRAIQNGFETLCVNAAELIENISNASQKGQLQQALFTYTHPHTLIIDEIGYLAHGQDAANVLFHVVNDRYLKKRPTIFTTNKPLSAWGKVLHDEDLAAAILDRVLERGRFIHLEGPSGRTGHQLDGQEHLPATPDGARISGIDRPKFPEPTSMYVSAMTNNGTLIRDLNPESLKITEDKAPVRIEKMNCGRPERILMGILVDVSGSRREDSQLGAEYDALSTFLDHQLTNQDGAYVIAFDDKIHPLSQLTSDRMAISNAFDQLKKYQPYGRTAVYDAIKDAAQAHFADRVGRRVAIVISDWGDNSSRASLYQAVAASQRSSTAIYAIVVMPKSVSSKKSYAKAVSEAKEFTQETGGIAYEVSGKPQLDKALDSIAEAVAGSCRVEYTIARSADGKKGTKLHVQSTSKGVSILHQRVRFDSDIEPAPKS